LRHYAEAERGERGLDLFHFRGVAQFSTLDP
jgi:hypothetical protein